MRARKTVHRLACLLDNEFVVLPVVLAERGCEGCILSLPCEIVAVDGQVVELADEVIGEAQRGGGVDALDLNGIN